LVGRRFAFAACVSVSLLCACGGNGTGNGGNSSNNGGTPTPPPSGSTNPCSTVALEGEPDAVVLAPDPGLARRKTRVLDHNPRWRLFDALWTNRQRRSAESATRTPSAAAGPDAVDVGEIAVLQDEGDLIAPANAFDLRGAGLRFTRNGSGGYDVTRIDGTFRSALGTRLTLTDDDSRQVDVPFAFSFYGQAQQTAFVNSDGNVTFDQEDRDSSDRNVARVLTGPPRVAPFFVDLDPTTGAGRVFANASADQYTVTWCGVRGFDSTRTTTAQMTLLPDGTIEFKYGDPITLADAIVAISPGRTGDFSPVNLSNPSSSGTGAVGERFAEDLQIDTVEIARKFYRTHPDDFDQLILWTDQRLVNDAFAYEVTVANRISGLGLELYDVARNFGSGGRLESYALMDFIGKYPDNPRARVLGENSTLSVLAHESGHRWLALFEFRDHTGRESDALLGRQLSHWSFFFDSDASVMEGNDIEDLGGGSFRTVAAAERYSLLDQYAMGLIPASQVPPFFYVENPVNVSPARDAEDAPEVGVRFNGTRRDVLIQDIIAIHGDRVPSSAQSPREHRQAFVFIVSAGRTLDTAQVDKIDRIRRDWEGYFQQATDGRMRVRTTLR
jgi:hypothetical protein